jgi:hypothetical protein
LPSAQTSTSPPAVPFSSRQSASTRRWLGCVHVDLVIRRAVGVAVNQLMDAMFPEKCDDGLGVHVHDCRGLF